MVGKDQSGHDYILRCKRNLFHDQNNRNFIKYINTGDFIPLHDQEND